MRANDAGKHGLAASTIILAMSRSNYIPAIDGLRAIAVLAVVLYHLDPQGLSGGFVGVDVFFVISGYVVTRSLARRPSERFGTFVSDFYARRVCRIIPALVVCLLVTVYLTVLFVPQAWLSATMDQVALAAFFGLSNVALVVYQDAYFSPRTEFNPFAHTWSLGVEEQFYVVFPVLIYFWFKATQKREGSVAVLHALVMPILAGLSLLWAAYAAQVRPDWGFYLLPARFWELAAGVLLFQWQDRGSIPVLSGRLGTVTVLSGVGLLVWSFFGANAAAFPFPWALVPVVGTVLLLWAVTSDESSNLKRLLSHRALVYVGKVSYSLYLWHWPVFTLMRWTVGLETLWTMTAGLVLSLSLASLSYRLIETPARQWRWLAASRFKAIAAGLLLVVGSWAVSYSLFQNRSVLSSTVTANQWLWYPYAHHQPDTPLHASGPLKGRQLFVIGNSHTDAYATMLSLLTQRRGITVHRMPLGDCAVGNLRYPVNSLGDCGAVIADKFASILARAKPGDVVMFASLRTGRLSDHWYRNDPQQVLQLATGSSALNAAKAARAELVPLLDTLRDRGLKVLIDAPKPVLKGPPYRCSDWFNRHNPICQGGLAVSRDFMEQLRQPVISSMEKLAQAYPNVYLWDPLPILCPDGQCRAVDVDGKPLFFDGDHLSGHGNRVLYPSFEAKVRELFQSD